MWRWEWINKVSSRRSFFMGEVGKKKDIMFSFLALNSSKPFGSVLKGYPVMENTNITFGTIAQIFNPRRCFVGIVAQVNSSHRSLGLNQTHRKHVRLCLVTLDHRPGGATLGPHRSLVCIKCRAHCRFWLQSGLEKYKLINNSGGMGRMELPASWKKSLWLSIMHSLIREMNRKKNTN